LDSPRQTIDELSGRCNTLRRRNQYTTLSSTKPFAGAAIPASDLSFFWKMF
jgi:hypothetical protein